MGRETRSLGYSLFIVTATVAGTVDLMMLLDARTGDGTLTSKARAESPISTAAREPCKTVQIV
jgi:hypothetical protein